MLQLNRETAILEFNRRVLGRRGGLTCRCWSGCAYICIVSSNMDEFFEVRVADYIEAARQPGTGVLGSDLASVASQAHALIGDQYACFNDG